MENYPVVRRRPRPPRTAPLSEDASLQTYAVPTIVVIAADDSFFDAAAIEHAEVWRWREQSGASDDHILSGSSARPDTYASLGDREDVTAIIALADPKQAELAAAAVQQAIPAAAALILGPHDEAEGINALRVYIDARVAFRATMADALTRIETLKRVRGLREFADQAKVVPILIHRDPDPDALASALAIRMLLRRPATETPIVTLDEITRPENRRMAELLDIQVTQVTDEELEGFERVICTDMQPRNIKPEDYARVAVIDHHPVEGNHEPAYVDIRPRYGATATILTEYLRAVDARWVSKRLATALLYGIKTDTGNLARGVSAADVEAYTFLLDQADDTLLRQIERRAYSEETARAFGKAVATATLHGDLAVAFLGCMTVDESHMLADVADFLLAIDE